MTAKLYTEAEAGALVAAAFEAAKRECLRTTPLGSGMSLQADRDDCVERIGALIPAAAKAHLDAMLKEAGRFVHEEMEMARKDARCSLYTNEDNPSLDCPATRGDTCTCKVIARAALDAMLAKAREEGRAEAFLQAKGKGILELLHAAGQDSLLITNVKLDERLAQARVEGAAAVEVTCPCCNESYIAGPKARGAYLADHVEEMIAQARAEGAAAEREACARECEAIDKSMIATLYDGTLAPSNELFRQGARQCAARIRARGKETKT